MTKQAVIVLLLLVGVAGFGYAHDQSSCYVNQPLGLKKYCDNYEQAAAQAVLMDKKSSTSQRFWAGVLISYNRMDYTCKICSNSILIVSFSLVVTLILMFIFILFHLYTKKRPRVSKLAVAALKWYVTMKFGGDTKKTEQNFHKVVLGVQKVTLAEDRNKDHKAIEGITEPPFTPEEEQVYRQAANELWKED